MELGESLTKVRVSLLAFHLMFGVYIYIFISPRFSTAAQYINSFRILCMHYYEGTYNSTQIEKGEKKKHMNKQIEDCNKNAY